MFKKKSQKSLDTTSLNGIMSISRAIKIKNIVADILIQERDNILIKESDLMGLSIYEIDIALKVFIAALYRSYPDTDESFLKLKKIAGQCSSLFMSVVSMVCDDREIMKLERLKKDSEEWKTLFLELFGDTEKKAVHKISLNFETHESFLNCLIHIGRKNLSYWKHVYSHLGIFYHPDLVDV